METENAAQLRLQMQTSMETEKAAQGTLPTQTSMKATQGTLQTQTSMETQEVTNTRKVRSRATAYNEQTESFMYRTALRARCWAIVARTMESHQTASLGVKPHARTHVEYCPTPRCWAIVSCTIELHHTASSGAWPHAYSCTVLRALLGNCCMHNSAASHSTLGR